MILLAQETTLTTMSKAAICW